MTDESTTMPLTSAEENVLSEQVAKFEALKEMLEDDVECDEPTTTEFINAADHLPKYKQTYLDVGLLTRSTRVDLFHLWSVK